MNDKDFYENDRDSIRYEGRRVHHEESFFERNCDEAWEQICETFSHPGRLLGRVLLVVLLCGVVAGGSYLLKIRAPQLPNKDDAQKDPNQTQVDEIDYGDGVRPRADGERKSKDFYTVLVLGRDTGGGGNTDTMLLASYDVTNQKATVMSIPRDTMVNVPWDIKKINSVYNYYGGGDKGIQALYKEIAQLVGFEPDYQVIVEWDAVGAIVEAMGGVYYDVPRNMNYDDPYQDLHIHFKKGLQHLSGQQSMEVVRFRHNNDNTGYGGRQDIGRIGTQQAFLKAVAQKLMKLENVPAMAETFLKYVKTDLTLGNLVWLANEALGMGGMDAISFATLPGDGTGWYKGMSVYALDPTQVLEMTNSMLNPYAADITAADQNILVP